MKQHENIIDQKWYLEEKNYMKVDVTVSGQRICIIWTTKTFPFHSHEMSLTRTEPF